MAKPLSHLQLRKYREWADSLERDDRKNTARVIRALLAEVDRLKDEIDDMRTQRYNDNREIADRG